MKHNLVLVHLRTEFKLDNSKLDNLKLKKFKI